MNYQGVVIAQRSAVKRKRIGTVAATYCRFTRGQPSAVAAACGSLRRVIEFARMQNGSRQWLHAYSNSRLSKIETTIDPVTPTRLEKEKEHAAPTRALVT